MATDLSNKIKEDYGTVKRFCEKNEINHNTYQVIVSGHATSKKITDILISHKYIKHADDLINSDCRVVRRLKQTAQNEIVRIENRISKYKNLIANERKKLLSLKKVA